MRKLSHYRTNGGLAARERGPFTGHRDRLDDLIDMTRAAAAWWCRRAPGGRDVMTVDLVFPTALRLETGGLELLRSSMMHVVK